MTDPIADRIAVCHQCRDTSDHPITAGWIFLPRGRWTCARCQRDLAPEHTEQPR